MRPTKVVLGILCILVSGCAASYTTVGFPEGWVEKEFPKPQSMEMTLANRSDAWFVRDSLRGIVASSPFERAAISLPTNGGRLVGVNGKEVGGTLKWIPDGDSGNSQIIDTQRLTEIFEWDGGVYYVAGSHHMGPSEGTLYKLDFDGNAWSPNHFLDLPEASYASTTTPNGALYLVTDTKLIAIQRDRSVKVISPDNSWRGLNPTSLVIRDNYALVGMSGGIMRVDLVSTESKWFVRRN